MIGIINQDSQAGWLPTIGNQKYLLAILVVAVMTGLMYIYLNYSKPGKDLISRLISSWKPISRHLSNSSIIRSEYFDPRQYCGKAREYMVDLYSHKIKDVLHSDNKLANLD